MIRERGHVATGQLVVRGGSSRVGALLVGRDAKHRNWLGRRRDGLDGLVHTLEGTEGGCGRGVVCKGRPKSPTRTSGGAWRAELDLPLPREVLGGNP